MTEVPLCVGDRYVTALKDHLTEPDEETPHNGYQLGRGALSDGVGLLDVATMHDRALRALGEFGSFAPLQEKLDRAIEFFAETLSPFEMSFRGYRDANTQLETVNGSLLQTKATIEAANRELEDRVHARTVELARAIDALNAEIAEKKKAEARLVQAQKMGAICNLTGGMAHDFNNLLGIILGNLDLVKGLAPGNAEIDEVAREALGAAFRGAELTRRLLAFARRQPLQPSRVDVNELVGGTGKLLTRTLGAELEITMELAPDLWPVTAVPAQLEAAIINLANNARDAMPKGGHLTISSSNRQLDEDYAQLHAEVLPGDYTMIEVSDTGMGMAPEIAAKIFEPFFTTKQPGKGTCPGLSIVFGFMKQSSGHINLYSEPGIGTTFRLYLPRNRDSVEAESRAVGDVILGSGQTILVVEDHANLRRLVTRQVRDLGYRLIEADNAATALDLLEQHPVDLLLTDIVMPGPLSGLDLARTTLERWPQMRVVLTSGFPARIGGSIEGATRLLIKPYRKADLARVLSGTLQG